MPKMILRKIKLMTLPTGIANVNTCLKWVCSSEILALQKIVVEYFSNSPLDFAPIHLKIAGLHVLLCIAKISNYSIPSLAPFMVVQYSAGLNC
jgi:hypothetical protein